jgi:hypothetical protein
LIPASYIQEWSTKTPWPTPQQVEQDLVISRALCDLFNEGDPRISCSGAGCWRKSSNLRKASVLAGASVCKVRSK